MTDDGDFPMSEASLFERDLYLEITIAWYQMQSRGLAVDRPMRSYVFGRGFAESVKDSPPRVELQHISEICALVVSSNSWELDDLKKVLDTQSIGGSPRTTLDPVCAWWYPLDRPSVLGVHYWELANGLVELRRLARFDKPPALQFGRAPLRRDQHSTDVSSRARQSA
jgi:hypothetical protein